MKLLQHFTKQRQAMNEHKRRQEAQAADRERFLADLAIGRVQVVDRYGNQLKVGDRILFQPPTVFDLTFEVVGIQPQIQPNAPPGLMMVSLQVRVPVMVPANVPQTNMLVLATRAPADQPKPDSNGGMAITHPPNGEEPPPDGSVA